MSGGRPGWRASSGTWQQQHRQGAWPSSDDLEGLWCRGHEEDGLEEAHHSAPQGGGAAPRVERRALGRRAAQASPAEPFCFISGAFGVEGGVRQDKDQAKIQVFAVWERLQSWPDGAHQAKTFFPTANA